MKRILSLFLLVFYSHHIIVANLSERTIDKPSLDGKISEYMREGKIPGLSLIIISDSLHLIKSYGYSDLKSKIPVNSGTLFELGSCSKAFTAIAILKLAGESKICLDSSVRTYIPWFNVYYNDSNTDISLWQLIHHTSGLPAYTISMIPQDNSQDALEKTVKGISGIQLHNLPGKKYEYATINYDVLALIIEKVTKAPFEHYMQKLFANDLILNNTYIGKQVGNPLMSKGYKTGFFRAWEYDAPCFKGNNAAGYVVTNAQDIEKWLGYQLGIVSFKYDSLILKSHIRDETVYPHDMYSYACGWNISLKGDGEISHEGTNPNFTSYIAFNKNNKTGVAVLANSNSPYTSIIGKYVFKKISVNETNTNLTISNSYDKAFSVVSIMFGIYFLFVVSFILYIIIEIVKRKRKFEKLDAGKIVYSIVIFLGTLPFLYGLYLIPKALAGFGWKAALVWTPISFPFAIIICAASILLSYLAFLMTLLFPEKNKYIKEAPKIILLSILSGLSNMSVILILTSALHSSVEIKYLIYYFLLSMTVYLVGRKVVQTRMIYLTRSVIYDLRISLINKVFATSYEKFEKIDRGRIYSTMNDDIGTIGQSANMFVNITTSVITAAGAFLYMATLAFWATVVTILLVGTISTIYYFVSRKTQPLFEQARESHTVYMRLLNGMIDGFKELNIHKNKKYEYKNDLESSTDEYRKKISKANIKFVNAFLIGESLLIVVLATVAFAIPKLFSDIQFYTLMSFMIILLYLIGPVNAILGSIPQFIQLSIAWNRIKKFIQDIPANLVLNAPLKPLLFNKESVYLLRTKDLMYKYNGTNEKNGFLLGPINLEVKKGEALFIIGGNGSGKTTLAKLLTGLYTPHSGDIFINDKKIESNEIGEYFSVVFNPLYLFKKLYNTVIDEKLTDHYLDTLILSEKVQLKNGSYSTIDLSGGQRKRLGLLQCFLENNPVYLFDEWAADQDPEYKEFFYKKLLPEMKKQGKIIIAITHDDHYFNMADMIMKLDTGKIEFIKSKHT